MQEMKMINAGKSQKEMNGITPSVPQDESKDKTVYPTLDISEKGYNSIPLDLEEFEAGDKVRLVLICNVKSKVETESKDMDAKKNDESCTGTLEVLKCGVALEGKKKSDEEQNSEELDKMLKH